MEKSVVLTNFGMVICPCKMNLLEVQKGALKALMENNQTVSTIELPARMEVDHTTNWQGEKVDNWILHYC